MKELIKRYKNYQKKQFILSGSKKKYAFIGIGTHSIANLYPVINHFRLDLKYIVTKSAENAELVNDNFAYSIGTNDLDLVLNDDEISGVFICTSPNAHFGLVKKVLNANKNVFVEKPPCVSQNELEDLIAAEKKSGGICMVGLQKQYAPCNLKLKPITSKGSCSYNYRFVTGAYPEGDAFLDLFIHPLSLINFLFGKVENTNVTISELNENITVLLQNQHINKTIGSVELSTNYSWQKPLERLIVRAAKGIYEMENTERLTFEAVSGKLFGIPLEKIFAGQVKTDHIENRNNFVPVISNNQLYTSGYYDEIKAFVAICEGKKAINNSTLSSCKDTYKTIFEIKNLYNV